MDIQRDVGVSLENSWFHSSHWAQHWYHKKILVLGIWNPPFLGLRISTHLLHHMNETENWKKKLGASYKKSIHSFHPVSPSLPVSAKGRWRAKLNIPAERSTPVTFDRSAPDSWKNGSSAPGETRRPLRLLGAPWVDGRGQSPTGKTTSIINDGNSLHGDATRMILSAKNMQQCQVVWSWEFWRDANHPPQACAGTNIQQSCPRYRSSSVPLEVCSCHSYKTY